MRGEGGHVIFSHRLKAVFTIFLLFLIAGSAVLIAGCGEEKISLEYDASSSAAIITVENDGGLPYPGDDLAPQFQLFGDGRVIKFQEGPNHGGVLVQGKLDGEAIGNLLQQIADTGFFTLKDEYRNPNLYDAPYSQISVGLAEAEKTVTVWAMKDVREFDAAYDVVMDYPLGEVHDFIPEQGYLVVVRYPLDENTHYDFLDPNGEIFQLLPGADALNRAASDHAAVAVDGATFLRIKKYENEQKNAGLYLQQADAALVVYPVYEPRTAKKG